MAQTDTEAYADPAELRDRLAGRHRDDALAALEYPDGDRCGYVAVTHALLALEARLDELACYVARLG